MKRLLAIFLCLFALSCASENFTVVDEVGTSEMELNYVTGTDAFTPLSFDRNFNDSVDTAGPYWVSFAYWTTTSDAAAGAFTADIEYVDPIGETRTINGVPISLDDPTGFYSSAPAMVQRQSGSSTWLIHFQLLGSAGASEVGYRVMHSAAANTDLAFW